MVIGVDAGALCVNDDRLKVGVYRVIFNLLKYLSKHDTKNSYRLYSFKAIPDTIMTEFSGKMDNLVLKPTMGWFRFRLPLSLFIHPVDLFLGVSQAIPSGSFPSIGFIYDLGFFHKPEAYPGSYNKLVSQTNTVAHHAKKIITISEASKKDIQDRYHLSEQSITVAYPGVDDRFTQHGAVFKSDRPYFLHVGSLKPGKNIPTLIQAFAQFRRQTNKDYLLFIIGGDYWLDYDILHTITQTGMDEYVRLLGYIPDALLPEYYRGATAFISPSFWEGFCLPAAEAMASGVPVIATNTGAFPEVVSEESLLVDPMDVQGFTTKMIQVIEDNNLREMVVAKGVAKSSEYNWDTFGSIILQTISS